LIFALFQNGVEWSRSTATRMAHLEGRLGRPIPALMTAVEITIMLARVEGRAFIEHPFTRFVLAGVVVFLAIVVITICFEGPRPEYICDRKVARGLCHGISNTIAPDNVLPASSINQSNGSNPSSRFASRK